jgi:hypothetical protein
VEEDQITIYVLRRGLSDVVSIDGPHSGDTIRDLDDNQRCSSAKHCGSNKSCDHAIQIDSVRMR